MDETLISVLPDVEIAALSENHAINDTLEDVTTYAEWRQVVDRLIEVTTVPKGRAVVVSGPMEVVIPLFRPQTADSDGAVVKTASVVVFNSEKDGRGVVAVTHDGRLIEGGSASVDDAWTIGSDASSRIVFNGNLVHDTQAVVEVSNGSFRVTDLTPEGSWVEVRALTKEQAENFERLCIVPPGDPAKS